MVKFTSPDDKLTTRGILQQAKAMRWQLGQGMYSRGWIYPVYDFDGSVLAHRWKAYDSAATPKYFWLNGSKAHYYHHGADLRGAIAEAGGLLYIVNGEPAVLTFHAAGLFNVLSFFGESSIPEGLAADLLALDVQSVRYYPDNDTTGERSAAKLRAALKTSAIIFDCRALPDELPPKGDTNDLWQHVHFDQKAFTTALNVAPLYLLPDPMLVSAPQRREAIAPIADETVHWDAERAYWWTQIVLPALDTVAPVRKGRGKYQYRHCPNPSHTDKTPSFRISTDKVADGLPICTCGVQDERNPREVVASWLGAPDFMTWWKAERAPLYKQARHSEADSVKTVQQEQAPELPIIDLISADVRVNLRYISELPLETFDQPGVYLIRSELATGKTELLKHLKKRWANKVLLGVDHRVTLTAELSRRLDCESQLDLRAADQRLPSALITTLPSIVNQIDQQSGVLRSIDVLFIDEVEQVLSALLSPTIDKRHRLVIYNTLVAAIKRAQYVICLDADAGSVAYSFLKSIREDVTLIVNEYRNTDRPMQTYASKEALQKALSKALDAESGVIGVACSSDKFAAKLARRCARKVGADKVMLVTGTTKHDPAVRAFLKNPDANASHFRVIIYTSAMGSGVDISMTHATAVFGFFEREPLTHWDMHQMLMRFRKADRYLVWIDPVERELLTDEKRLFERFLDQEQGTKVAVLFDEDGNDLMRQSRLQLAHLQAAVTARENRSKHSVLAHFMALAAERYTIAISSDKISKEERQQIRAEMKAAGQAIKQEYEQRILAATPISDEKYKQYAARGEVTPKVEAGHVRQQIEHLYAQEITPQTIHDYDDGKGIGRIKLFESLYHPQSEAIAYDRAELVDNVPIGDLTHGTKKRMLMIEALRPFISPDRTFSADVLIDIDTINQVVGTFRDTHERDIRRYHGWRKDYSTHPLDLLRFMLGEVGLKLEEAGADRQRLYRERKALQKQGVSREEAITRLPAPLKRYRLNKAVLTQQERYIAQRRARALQDSAEEFSLSLRAKVAA